MRSLCSILFSSKKKQNKKKEEEQKCSTDIKNSNLKKKTNPFITLPKITRILIFHAQKRISFFEKRNPTYNKLEEKKKFMNEK